MRSRSSSSEAKTLRPGKRRCRLRRWGDFRRELAALIRLLREAKGRFIIIGHRSRHLFVQFCISGDGSIRGESISNNFLEKGERLTAATCRQLVELSWKKPGKPSANYWSAWQPPLPIERIALLAVTTLRDVFEITSPNELEIVSEEFADEKPGIIRLVGGWKPDGPRGRGIKINRIAHFNARGMHRVYGRTVHQPVGNHTSQRNIDVWLARDGRILARFWALGSEVDEESYEIIGLSYPPIKGKEVGLNQDWVPESLRDKYQEWMDSNC